MPINIDGQGIAGVSVDGQAVANVYVDGELTWTADTGGSAFGRPSILRSVNLAFPGRASNPGDGVDRFYPYDYTGPEPFTQGGNAFLWVAKPSETTTITDNGNIDIRRADISTPPSAVSTPALVNGTGGAVGYQVAMPSVGTAYTFSNFPGLIGNASRNLYAANHANLRATPIEFNVSLTGITQWVGNAFYTPPDITSLETVRGETGLQTLAGFYVLGVPEASEVRYEATRSDGAGGTIVYADETTNRVGCYVSNPLDQWGLSFVTILTDGSFYGDFDSLEGVGPVNVDIRVV